MARVKGHLKRLYTFFYFKALPLLVKPPHVLYDGELVTVTRASIMELLNKHRSEIHGRVLDVGVGTWEYPRQLLRGRCEYISTDCVKSPSVDVYSDIHRLTDVFEAESFDFVICTDVLEHVARPWIAIRQIYAILKPGGTLLLTIPFNFHLHGNRSTGDYWRISADGLHQLIIGEAGFREAEITPIGPPEYPFCHTVVARK